MLRDVVIVTGKLPPPYIGPAVATELILQSKLRDEFNLVHFNTSDHRDITTLAALDFQNFYLAFLHYARLIRLIVSHRPALVYIPAGQTTVGYARDAGFIWIAKLLGCKVLCHLRGGHFRDWIEAAGPATRWLVRVTHGRVDGQIVLGERLRRLFEGYVPANRTFVVPNGGDFPATAHTRPAGDPFRVVFVANLQRTKGVLETLDAARLVAARHPHVEFVCVGSWVETALREQAESALAADRSLPVRFPGPVSGDAKFRLLASSDVFVLPTYYPNEGHPWAIVEAMSFGLPVISTDHAAIPDAVHHGVNGFLVEKRSAAQLAERIIELIEQPELRRQMGLASRRIYEAEFTEARMVSRLGEAFRAIITRPSRRRERAASSPLAPGFSGSSQ